MLHQMSVKIQEALNRLQIDPGCVNLIMPSESFGSFLGDYDTLALEVVKIDPDPKAGDVFEISKGRKSLAKGALNKISGALCITWDINRTGIIESRPDKSRARAVGALKKPNGQWMPLSEEKTVDMDVIEEEQQIKWEEEAEKGRPDGWGRYKKYYQWGNPEEKKSWINLQVRKSVLQYKKFKDERAVTGAKNRAIKAIVPLKTSYTDGELNRPFVFPRIMPNTAKMLHDSGTREAAVKQLTGIAAAVFGIPQHSSGEVICEDEPIIIPAPEESGEYVVPVLRPVSEEIEPEEPQGPDPSYDQAAVPDQQFTPRVRDGKGAKRSSSLDGKAQMIASLPGQPGPTEWGNARRIKKESIDVVEDIQPEYCGEEPPPVFDESSGQDPEKARLLNRLEGYRNDRRLPAVAKKLINNLLKHPDPGMDEIEALIKRVNKYIEKKAGKRNAGEVVR